MELAYRLAVSDEPYIKQIRDNVIVSITGATDVDGRDRYVDWYYAYKIDELYDGGENYGGPPYWGKYVFHDNNRDINYGVDSLRAHLNWYLNWVPPIWHDLHEAQTLLYTFSGQPPQNANLDPILYTELPFFATYEVNKLTRLRHARRVALRLRRHVVARLSRLRRRQPQRHAADVRDLQPGRRQHEEGAALGRRRRTRQWYRPNPAPAGEVDWSIRNSINYAETGVLTALELTSKFPTMVVENYYKKSANAMKRGADKPPHAFVIPAGQRDQTQVDRVANLLRRQAIEVHRATAEIKVKEGTFPAGSYIVKLNQPYGPLAKTLLEKQTYPDPALTTYDDSAWTMGMANNIDVKTIEDKTILDAAGDAADAPTSSTAGCDRAAHRRAVTIVKHNGALNLITLRYRLKDVADEGREGRVQGRRRRVPGRLVRSSNRPAIACARKSRRSAWSRPRAASAPTVRDRRRRSAAHRDVHHVVEHGEGRLGPARVRSLGDSVRPDPQGSRAGRREPAREVRRDRDAAPDAKRQVDRLRAAEAVEAAALQEERQVQVDGLLRRNRRCARRHGAGGRGGVPEVRRTRAAC